MKYIIAFKRPSEAGIAVLSYGREHEPSPELLLDRDRATIFDTQDDAENALKTSLIQAEKAGATWTKKYSYQFIECE